MIIEDEELRNLYEISSKEHLQKLEAALLHLLEHPDNETLWDELRRKAHSLKGDSRSVGLETVEVLSHQIEKILLGIKSQEISFTLEVGDCLFQGLNAIGLLVEEAVSGQPSEVDITQILNQLMAVFLQARQPQTTSQLVPTLIEEELRNLYKISSEEHLQKLEAGLLHLLEYPDDEILPEELRREVHNLKGDSRSIGLETVEVLSHHFEEILLGIKRQEIAFTLEVGDRLFQGLNAISLLVQEAVTGQPSGLI